MRRRSIILLAITIPTMLVAGWMWLRPYDWTPGSGAPAKIHHATLTRDHNHYWLDIKLDVTKPKSFEFSDGLTLKSSANPTITPAGLQLIGDGEVTPTADGPEIKSLSGFVVKFWLEKSDLSGPLHLQLGEHELRVRQQNTPPALDNAATKTFQHSNW